MPSSWLEVSKKVKAFSKVFENKKDNHESFQLTFLVILTEKPPPKTGRQISDHFR